MVGVERGIRRGFNPQAGRLHLVGVRGWVIQAAGRRRHGRDRTDEERAMLDRVWDGTNDRGAALASARPHCAKS